MFVLFIEHCQNSYTCKDSHEQVVMNNM